MSLSNYLPYLAIIVISTYLIRTIPFIAIKKRIEKRFVKSFLYYIPFTVLTAMTIPAIFTSTSYVLSALIGLIIAIILALKDKSLTTVALCACAGVFVSEFILSFI